MTPNSPNVSSTLDALPFQPNWPSLRTVTVPQWLREGKFGVYTHWGVYSVHGMGPNSTWYANQVYWEPESEARKSWEQTWGPLSKFGYKDLIPHFRAERFDADEWADLFVRSGARFAGPVAEHHDGFAMWDSKLTPWNSARMGPKRDVVGEMAAAIKKRNMKLVAAFHHAENWLYFPTFDSRYDCSDPRYVGLYGFIHEKQTLPSREFLELWRDKIIEVVNKYEPDMVWFDNGLELIADSYKQDVLAHYYNHAQARHKQVVVTYKRNTLPPGAGLLDLERGQETDLTYYEWITDSTVDDGGRGWGYVKGLGFKTAENLITNLVDRVSKNGYLLLNVGPRADGTIPDEARNLLLAMGDWLKINGECIYDTCPWVTAGEGPTRLAARGDYNEINDLRFTPQDIRFTTNGDNLYAIALAWPGEKLLITSMVKRWEMWTAWCGLYPSEIASITLLGDGRELKWEITPEGLLIHTPSKKPCEHAFVFKIVRRRAF